MPESIFLFWKMTEIYLDNIPQDFINSDYIKSIYNKDNFEITFFFKSDFKNSKFLRDYLVVILDVIWVDKTWKNRFTLIIDELNNNAIEYWSKEGNINIMRFKSQELENKVVINIEVEDAWDWIKAKKAIEMEELRDSRLEKWFDDHKSIRWRGLFLIITKLVDKLYFKDSLKWGLVVGIDKEITLL